MREAHGRQAFKDTPLRRPAITNKPRNQLSDNQACRSPATHRIGALIRHRTRLSDADEDVVLRQHGS